MSQPDEPRRPRPKRPASGGGARPPAPDGGWRQPTEPDDDPDLDRPKARSRREPAPATGGPKLVERVLFGKVSSGHLASFCRQFATYSDAGVDLMKSLQALEKQFGKTALGPILGRLVLRIRQGDTVAEAMAREPDAFDAFFLSMVRVAEARGGLPETMRAMADHYDARIRLIRQARSAMIYPIIVVTLALGLTLLLSIFLLPIFADFLKDLTRSTGEGSLPLPSRVLMAFSGFVTAAGWWLIPLVVVGSVVAGLKLYGTAGGKAAMDEVGLKFPVLGKILNLLDTSRFARTMGALLSAGVDMNASLDLTADVVRLAPYKRATRQVKALIKDGSDLSEAMGETGRFGSDVIAIVNSGEETGKIPECLDRLADDYEERVEYMVKNLGSLVQPIIMVVLGGLVLFIILAVFLPYLAALTALTK